MAARKIALTIAGGTSLGAYEAGALSEMLYALDYLQRERGERFEIDVITGGSAGSITGALVGRAILHDRVAMSRALYAAWVEETRISEFLESPPFNSLLANRVQHDLARRYFGTSRVPYDPAHARARALSPDQERLVLAFSLANMVGVDWGFDYAPVSLADDGTAAPHKFISTFFAEYAEFQFDRADPALAQRHYDPDYWKGVSDSAIASGTFPLAFPPFALQRRREDYPEPLPPPDNRFPAAYYFVDGGMFANEPVGRAIRHAAAMDGGVAASDRLFILVDPNLNRSKRDERFHEMQGFADIVKRLPGIIWGQSQARDWLRSERYNAQADWRDRFATELAKIVNALPEAELEPRISTLRREAERVVEHKRRVQRRSTTPSAVRDDLEDALARSRSLHREGRDSLGHPSADTLQERKREAFDLLMFMVNSIGGMGRKGKIALHAITTEESVVAGDPWFGFLGFFDRRFREHDYRLGRRNVHALLPGFLETGAYPREGGAAYDADPAWGNLGGVGPRDVDRDVLARVADHAVDQVERIVREPPFRFGWLKRQATRIIVRTMIRRALER